MGSFSHFKIPKQRVLKNRLFRTNKKLLNYFHRFKDENYASLMSLNSKYLFDETLSSVLSPDASSIYLDVNEFIKQKLRNGKTDLKDKLRSKSNICIAPMKFKPYKKEESSISKTKNIKLSDSLPHSEDIY